MSPINTNRLNRLRYGIYSPVYDWLAKPLANGRARAFDLLQVQPGEKVLIIGAGTGLDIRYLSLENDITAIDLTPQMLTRAEIRARRLGLDVQCRVMNAHALDLPDESFDVVVLHLVLAVLPDPEACISEAARVLKTDGRLSIFDKFLPDNAKPSLFRRIVGAATNVLFSDINRQLGPLLTHAGLREVRKEPSFLGLYRVCLVKKVTEHG